MSLIKWGCNVVDDGKRENETKRSKNDHVKSILSLYLQKRQLVNRRPKTISKTAVLSRAALNTRISRPSSTLDNLMSEPDPLLVEYNLMFQKFVFWLKDQMNRNHRCYDIEKLVGPLFCHLYMDICNSNGGKSHEVTTSSQSFFEAHVEKVDKSKCDDTIKDILQMISAASENVAMNGSEILNLDKLKHQFRSNKVVAYIKSESLMHLKKFVASSCRNESHIVLLQALQSWFDLRVVTERTTNNYVSDDSKKDFKFLDISCEAKDDFSFINIEDFQFSFESHENSLPHNAVILTEDLKDEFKDFQLLPVEACFENHAEQQPDVIEKYNKIKNVIKKTKNLPPSVCNIKVLNPKGFITCGLIRSHIGLAAFAEKNILRVMPIQVLVNLVCDIDQIDHIKFVNHSKQIYCVALCPKNDMICTGSADHSICIYSLNKAKLHRRLFGHLGAVYSIAISDNSKYLASGSNDGTARLWDLKTGKPLRVFAAHTDAITSVHFHPNSIYLATGSADKNVRIWCLNTANTIRLLHSAKKEVFAVAFSPNGKYLASASDDKKVRIWDITSCKVINEFKNRESSVVQLLWSQSSKHLCGGTALGVVKIWEVKDKEKDHTNEHKHSESVIRRYVNGRLLSLDCTFKTWTCLSVPKRSPFDSI